MWRVLVVAGLLVLAGCSGGTTPTPTLTPVPVPDSPASASPTPAPDDAVTGPGGPAPFALADAHANALENRSFTAVHTLVVRNDTDTLRRVNRTVRVASGGRTFHAVETATSAPSYPVSSAAPRVEIWFAGPPALFRIGTENVSYQAVTAPDFGGLLGDRTAHDRLVGLYGGFEDWRTRCSPRGCRLRGSQPTDVGVLALPLLLSNVSNATFTARLTPDRRVRRYRLAFTASLAGRRVRVVRTVRFTAVGKTTVSRPAWVDEARTATGDAARDESKAPL